MPDRPDPIVLVPGYGKIKFSQIQQGLTQILKKMADGAEKGDLDYIGTQLKSDHSMLFTFWKAWKDNEGDVSKSMKMESPIPEVKSSAGAYFTTPQGKRVKLEGVDLISISDKKLNKVYEALKKKFPQIKEISPDVDHTLAIARQEKQAGMLNETNSELNFFVDNLGKLNLKR
jgi:hypothetical protein